MTPTDHLPTAHSQLRRSHPAENDDVDIRRYVGLFLSNWYWFAASLFIAGLLSYGINTYSERAYTVSAFLLVKSDQGGPDMTGMDQVLPGGNIFSSQQNLQNEMGILKSFSLNNRVMHELPEFHVTIVEIGRRGIAQRRHYRSEPFVVVYDSIANQTPGLPVRIRIRSEKEYSIEINGTELSKEVFSFGERFNEAGFDFRIILRDPENFRYNDDYLNKFTFWFNQSESLANDYRGKLSITPLEEDASLLELSVSGPVPLQEAEYLNTLMEVYIQQGLDFKNQTAENTIKFINTQLRLIADSLAKAETRLENFRLSNKLIDLSSEGAVIINRLETYTKEKIAAGLQKQYYEYLDNYIRTRNESGEIISPSVMGVTDPILPDLVNELARLQIEKKQLKYSFSDNQPAISFADSKIEDARNILKENVRNSLLNIDITIGDIDFRISEMERELNKLPGTERRFINIQRTFDLNNTVYTYMLEKRSEAGIAKASNVSGNRIIDTAEPFNSFRIRPTESRNYMIALILGLLVPGLYIYLMDRFHNKIIDKRDIERGTQVPIIGFVGHNTSKDDMPFLSRPGTSLAESFRSIRTNLKFYINSESKAVISITSTISGEGKTFISLNLAAALSMLGKKTLLVGMDLRKPKLDKIFNTDGKEGLTTFLIGETTYDEVIHKTTTENLFFVPSGPVPPNPTELIETEMMRKFMAKAREDFDYIILDTPPIGIVSDALLLGSYADVNIFIIRQHYSFKSTLEYIQNIFNKKELKNLTIAVNDIHISGYYGYGLRYGYGFYEGYGYNYGYGQYGSYGRGDYHKYYTEE
jgi:capsular exopolysaccharide synthesis family protein